MKRTISAFQGCSRLQTSQRNGNGAKVAIKHKGVTSAARKNLVVAAAGKEGAPEGSQDKVSKGKRGFGAGGGGRKKTAAPVAPTGDNVAQWQAIAAVKPQQPPSQELEELQTTAASLQDDLDLLYAKYKEQALQMDSVKSEAEALRQQIAASGAKGKDQEAEVAALVEALRSQLAASVQAEAVAKTELVKYQSAASDLKQQIELLTAECKQLSESRLLDQQELSDLRAASSAKTQRPILSLEDHLQEVSNSVEEVYELRRDLQVLAEAFKEKEDEGIVLQNALVEVEVRYQEIQSELEVAKVHEVSTSTELASTLLQLNQAQAELIEAKQSIINLGRRSSELEDAIRARDRVSGAVESKTAELEQSLVGFSTQIMELRGDLSVKEHALFEAGNRLKGADQDMSFLRSEVERLSAALQESDSRGRSQQAGGSQFLEKDLVQLRREVDRLKGVERDLSLATSLSLQRDAESSQAMAAAVKEKQDLKEKLDRQAALIKEFEALKSQSYSKSSIQELQELRSALALRDSELAQALAQKLAIGSELGSTKQELAMSQQQLQLLRKDTTLQVEKLSQANGNAIAAESALAELQAELAAECLKTQELLTQAERLVMSTSSFEEGDVGKEALQLREDLKQARQEAQESASRAEVLDKQVSSLHEQLRSIRATSGSTVNASELLAAEARIAAAQAETLALKQRVSELSRLSGDRDSHAKEMKETQSKAVPKQLQDLNAKVELLQAENFELKQTNLKQKQLLSQTRGFLKDRAVNNKLVPQPQASTLAKEGSQALAHN